MINVLESDGIDAIVVNRPPVATPALHDCGVFAELLPRHPRLAARSLAGPHHRRPRSEGAADWGAVVSATPDNASGYCRPLDRMTVEHVSQGWPKPQGRSHDAPSRSPWLTCWPSSRGDLHACMVIR